MSLFSFRRQPAEPDPEEVVVAEVAPAPRNEAENSEPEPVAAEPPPVTIEPYASSQEHLWHELARVDQLVRAQTVRWQTMIAATKPEQHWGMLHVTDAEVNTYLQVPFIAPDQLPGDLIQQIEPFWRNSHDIAANIEARLAQTPASLRLRLRHLQMLFGLDRTELDLILLCLLPEVDGRYQRLYGYLMDDCSRLLPTVSLLLQILQPAFADLGDGRQMLAASSPLLVHHLVRLVGAGYGQEPLSLQSVRLDERIVNYLLGQDELDGRLPGIATLTTPTRGWEDLIMEEARLARLQTLAGWWQERSRQGAANATLLLRGPYGSDRLAAAEVMAATASIPLLVVDVAQAQQAAAGWQMVVDLSYREALLAGAAVYWAGCEQLLASEQTGHLWDYLTDAAERYDGLTCLASQTAWEPANRFRQRPFLRLEFPEPAYDVRQRLWLAHLPPPDVFAPPAPETAVLAMLLANSFQFTRGQILDALTAAHSIASQRRPDNPRLTVDDLYDGCRRQSSQRLVTMARRLEPRTALTFDDLILPAANRRQLQELRDRIQHRSQVYSGLGFEHRLSLGKGLIALFTGTSGTGKTMAAELLACEQGVDLYKVDLSAVVSKYVGETEKNLSRVFAEAEDANAIIFFDEADALFGKRGEVKEARDRWANMEINYLLQRIEEYAGVVILTSNLRQNIDEAFLRRIHVIVEFPFPNAEARFHIWRGIFPTGVQRPADEELYPLADRFKLTGGSLKNIVVDAAFRALAEAGADEQPVITIRHLVAGTGREYQKLGKPISRGEFGQTYYEWLQEDVL
jgi:hypothetical protein